MLRFLFAAGLVAAANCCNPSVLTSAGAFLDGEQCKTALAPTAAEQQLDSAALTKCIAEQAGLQATIDSLRAAESGETSSAENTQSAEGNDDSSEHHHDAANLLEANGHTTEATTLRQCIARERKMLTTSLTYDMDKLKANILAKVEKLTIEANTTLGLNGCPAVVDYNVSKYMKCISNYCKTGAA